MENKSEMKRGITKRAFIQSFIILLSFMLIAGILTRIVPTGHFGTLSIDGEELVDYDTFIESGKTDYPIWRWFTAPFEVLAGPDKAIIITIIIVILLIEGSFAILDRAGILKAVLTKIVHVFGKRKYILMAVTILIFMLFGAMFGVFEEVIPIVSIVVPLAYALGWDALTGLGMSILATGFGFSAAILNPFSLGVAQELADLPAFSGAAFRVLIFITIYAIFTLFLTWYAKHIDHHPENSPVHEEDKPMRDKYTDHYNLDDILPHEKKRLKRGTIWFIGSLTIAVLLIATTTFIPGASGYGLPIMGLMFLIGGIGAGLLSGLKPKKTFLTLGKAILGMLPGVILIMMAMSVKFIITEAGVMDTLLYRISLSMQGSTPFVASVMIYGLTLFMNFFIGSASAKAVLIMPLMAPLADILGVSRQIAVTAFCFGDGFSNMLYPTNPILLIALSLTVVSYPKWLKWVIPIQIIILIVSIGFLAIANLIGYH